MDRGAESGIFRIAANPSISDLNPFRFELPDHRRYRSRHIVHALIGSLSRAPFIKASSILRGGVKVANLGPRREAHGTPDPSLRSSIQDPDQVAPTLAGRQTAAGAPGSHPAVTPQRAHVRGN